MKAIILAAGKSTRTYPLTLTRPKPLLEVANKPLLEYTLAAVKDVADGAVLVVGYMSDRIREAFGDRWGALAIEYVEQSEQRGTGHAVLQCEDLVGERFLVLNGDDIYDPADVAKLADQTRALLAERVEDVSRFGELEVDNQGRILKLIEKPAEPRSNLASVGAYALDRAMFDVLKTITPSDRGEIELTAGIQALLDRAAFSAIEMNGYWFPMSYPWNLLDASEFFLKNQLKHDIRGEISDRAEVNGPVAVGEGSVVRSGVVIDGPVLIGRDCSVGPNCWLRPGCVLGDGCRVGQAVEIKNAILMNRATVAHLTYVGDSVIGEGANLGCGTITANLRHDGANVWSMVKGERVDTGRRKLGAIVGDHAHTGINTSIYPGRKLWPHTATRPGTAVDADIET